MKAALTSLPASTAAFHRLLPSTKNAQLILISHPPTSLPQVLRSRVLLREQNPNSPFGDDSSQVRLSWPGLLPDFTKGETVPFVYNQTRLRLLDPRLQRPPWLAWLLSDMGCALAGAFLFAVVAVGFALGAPRARRAGGRRRGRGEDECLGLPLPGARGRRRADD